MTNRMLPVPSVSCSSSLRSLAAGAACAPLLFALGCGTPSEPTAPAADEVAQTQQRILGGTPTTGDPAIVALYAVRPGADKGALCTATVIAPKVVLTAAHCVHPDLVGADATFSVLVGADLTDKTKPPTRLAVKETHYDAAFDKGNLLNGHDIAVAILDAPTTITPIPYNTAPLAAADVGKPARLVGYGLNDSFGQTGAGIKRELTLKLNGFDDKLVKTGELLRGICSGDSGGPVLMKVGGVEKVVGVNSFGFLFCLFEGNSTRVDMYKEFVAKYL